MEIKIGDFVLDKSTNKRERVVNKTINSICITQTKLSEKGINCTQWFTDLDFKRKFI
jgi:hypothetical protein